MDNHSDRPRSVLDQTRGSQIQFSGGVDIRNYIYIN